MTDEQIIEALEWCTYLDDCDNCPYYKKDCNCATIALDLIYRQKAEIERLECEIKNAQKPALKFTRRKFLSSELAVAEMVEKVEQEIRRKMKNGQKKR